MISTDTKEQFQKMNQIQLNSQLINACSYGQIDIVKYLLTSPDLKQHADIHARNDSALSCACNKGHLDLVIYLLTSSYLKEHANIYAQYDNAFIGTVENGHLDIIHYFIFDYQIEKTKDIEEYLVDNKTEDILFLFEKRQFQQKLQSKLYIKNNKQTNKLKI